MKARRLNDHGLAQFGAFVENLRLGQPLNVPEWLLEGKDSSESIDLEVELDGRQFESRYEMGKYLVELLKDKPIQKYLGDAGFWSWLALYWFEQLSPKKDGNFRPARSDNYLLSGEYNLRPRHAVYIAWQLVNRYGEQARVFLCNDMSKRGDLTEQFMTRQWVLSCEGVMGLASDLYFDNERSFYKRGAASKGAGSARRFITWLQQLELTYDLYTATAGELKALLPAEFARFKTDN